MVRGAKLSSQRSYVLIIRCLKFCFQVWGTVSVERGYKSTTLIVCCCWLEEQRARERSCQVVHLPLSCGVKLIDDFSFYEFKRIPELYKINFHLTFFYKIIQTVCAMIDWVLSFLQSVIGRFLRYFNSFIHSFILNIYIAPLQENYSEFVIISYSD